MTGMVLAALLATGNIYAQYKSGPGCCEKAWKLLCSTHNPHEVLSQKYEERPAKVMKGRQLLLLRDEGGRGEQISISISEVCENSKAAGTRALKACAQASDSSITCSEEIKDRIQPDLFAACAIESAEKVTKEPKNRFCKKKM